MSFQNKNFWIPTEATGCLADGSVDYNISSSRAEQKRPHQWFMDPSEPELSRNKKQATDASNTRLVSGLPNMSYPTMGNQANFAAVPPQFANHMFNSDNFRNSNLVDMNIPMVGTGDLNMGREGFGNPYGSTSSVGLSMSRTIGNPSLGLDYSGIRKVHVNQVGGSQNSMHVSSGQSYNQGVTNVNGISLGPVFNGGESSGLTMSAGVAFNKMDGSFISMGHSMNKGGGNFMLMGQPFHKGNGGFVPMGNPNNPSIGPAYNKENGNFISVGPSVNNVNGSFISVGPSYVIGSNSSIISPDSSDKGKSIASTVTDCDKGSYNNGEGGSISFGGVQEERETHQSADMVNSFSLPATQNPEVGAQENSTEIVPAPVPARAPKTNAAPKNKEPKAAKKAPVNNNFPTHVKSLLSTGILDGVPVKYVAWSREKSALGMIKNTSYLCGCNDCDFNKALNAYEFERHAGCKTKHPNNHIYFENGKTIYAVVQELKMTPADQLFEAIEKCTGSEIHQENFKIWKASYLAASRELQRIYGKEERQPLRLDKWYYAISMLCYDNLMKQQQPEVQWT